MSYTSQIQMVRQIKILLFDSLDSEPTQWAVLWTGNPFDDPCFEWKGPSNTKHKTNGFGDGTLAETLRCNSNHGRRQFPSCTEKHTWEKSGSPYFALNCLLRRDSHWRIIHEIRCSSIWNAPPVRVTTKKLYPRASWKIPTLFKFHTKVQHFTSPANLIDPTSENLPNSITTTSQQPLVNSVPQTRRVGLDPNLWPLQSFSVDSLPLTAWKIHHHWWTKVLF